MKIDIISDVVCPWCLIGKRRLEKALSMRPDYAVEITWRAYQLHPDLPPEGMDKATLLAQKFGSKDRASEIFEHIATEGRSEGLDFAFDKITRAPNTLDAHCLIRWAGSAGCQDGVVEDLFAAYFFLGKDISNHDELIAIARKNGMDADLVAGLLESGRDQSAVARECNQAREMGISGVPSFIFDGKIAVNGAHQPEQLCAVMDQLLSQTKAGVR
ncbi:MULTISPECIES: DsbA family oxidoreductase [unclassified Iodidimonas]|jgi:predicted DsbA family dithiol-disulfide isomerase|uniref:DsbA family oxidoreductase n=1 Tax=unclassified Iodidimonas TaxID=2626145 RepID=UPI0024822F70|nr:MULTISPECIES: DsbA family oxidoreductase [unclassified Iodidimonas]